MKIDPGLERSLVDVKRTWKVGNHIFTTLSCGEKI